MHVLSYYSSVSKKKTKQQQQQISGGGAHGGCFQDLEICEINISKGIWRGRARTFLWFFTSFELRAVGRNMFSTFHRHVLLQLLNPYHIISAVIALQAAAQLGNACSTFCVLCDDHVSIDRPVCPFFAWPAIVDTRIIYLTNGDAGYCFTAAPISCHHT